MRVERVMGTAVRFETGESADAVDRAVAWLAWVEDVFTVHKPDSQVMQLRRGEIDIAALPPEVTAVLERCMALRILTDGHFDHRPEGDLDPSGYVKGWAIEGAVSILAQAGPSRFYVDAGGDIAVRGRWKIGIRNPRRPAEALFAVELEDESIATAGAYMRGAHIWGKNPGGLNSVSVIGPDLGTADAISTAVFSCGGDEVDWLARFPRYRVIAITDDLRVLHHDGREMASVSA